MERRHADIQIPNTGGGGGGGDGVHAGRGAASAGGGEDQVRGGVVINVIDVIG